MIAEFFGAHALRRAQPHVEGRFDRLHLPTKLAKTFDSQISALDIQLVAVFDMIGWAVETGYGSRLYSAKHIRVDVRFDFSQVSDGFLIANREADSPSRHIVGLRECMQFDGDIFGSLYLENRRRFVAVVGHLGI